MTENMRAQPEATIIKNPPAIFILSPPRSGSTLLRVMLAGHPLLFAPQELELLSFDTLQERRAAFVGRNSFWLEGTVRAIMEIKSCDAEHARKIMEGCENEQLTTKRFYWLMQQWIGQKILVDKTPSYALSLEILRRAEAIFDRALYIDLLRHPYGMIRSFEDSKLDQLYQVFFRSEHRFTARELAELIWLISHQNISTFLNEVPAERQHRVRFEDLVTRPGETMEGICQFLGLKFHPDMIEPYRDQKKRMTDGIYPESRMLGDVKFREHTGINAKVGDRWREYYTDDFLGDDTWQVAEQMGYKKETPQADSLLSTRSTLMPIQPVARDGSVELPLSFAQQRLWFLDQLQPGLLAYNMSKAFRLSGQLNVGALEQSFSEILRRHEVLRSTFPTVDGQPVQVISRALALTLPVVDLRGLPQAEWEDEVQRRATEEAQRPFGLAQGPLLRATLLKLCDEEHILLLTVHHIVFDGWSFDVLFRELKALYQLIASDKLASLPQLVIQYLDFAHWQREWLQGKALESQLSYWRKQLDNLTTVQLPTDRPRPAVQSFRGRWQPLVIANDLSEALKTLSRKEGVTLFMTLLAAFQTLLYRYTGQEDIAVGSPIAGRNRAEVERLIGFFATTLVLRTHLSGKLTFRELLSRVREVALGAYGHQDVPFEKLVEELHPDRELSRNPLFDVMFAFQNVPRQPLKLSCLAVSPVETKNETAKFDLSLYTWNEAEGLKGYLEYNTDLFDAATITRMLGHFKTLLQGIVANPDQHISELPLLSDAEKHQVLVEWNNTQRDYPKDKCVQQLFEAQVEKSPDSIAVVFEDQKLTYRQLNQGANQLAHYLRKLGVGPETLVGICVERSLEMVVGLLGILKAGGAYLPLDPIYPKERLAFMMEDSRASVLITQRHLMEELFKDGHPRPSTLDPRLKVVCLDSDWKDITQHSNENPDRKTTADNLAYVIFTSGSTGRPKGVQISHASVVNLLGVTHSSFHFDERDVWTVVHSYAFDFSVWEIWGCILHGGRLVVVPLELTQSPGAFYDLLCRERVTVLNQTPSAIRQLIQVKEKAGDTARHLSLRLIICGGEAFPQEVASSLLEWNVPVWNFYGPTEATVWAAINQIESIDSNDRSIPIGRPLSNIQIYILNSHLQPVPIGVPGELHIGGVSLARGYLNRPELTAEKFIPDLYGDDPGARLYNTGDLARYLPDGNVEFLGRADHQVKIRGFRIELGEIEAVLRQYPGVRESMALVRETEPGNKRLVAYLMPNQEPRPTATELRSYLKAKLPDYMIPSAFVWLEALPLTSNGKVDRRRLPEPDTLQAERGDGFVAPRTPMETFIAGVWQEVLGVDRVSLHDNFFDLGGHSLLSMKVIARIEKQTGQRINPREIIFGTLEQLAAMCEQELLPVQESLPRRLAKKLPEAIKSLVSWS